MSSGIYCILCTANGKRYVGQSVAMKRRLTAHLGNLRHGVHHNAHLQAAFQKYGAESFETSALEECAEDMLDIRERAWISYYQSTNPEFGYNQESGGRAQKYVSEETRRRISEALRGKPLSEEHRRRLSASKRGTHLSEETRRRIGEATRGRPVSAETRAKRSETMRQRCATPEARAKRSEAHRGKKHTPEAKARMSAAHRGKKHTPETKARISKAGLGRKPTSETRAKLAEARKLYLAGKKSAATQPQIG